MEALIVVDYQNDFSDYGKVSVRGSSALGNKILSCINFYKKNNNKVVFSLDWHPKNHSSFDKWGEHCIKDEHGSELMTPLTEELADKIIKKGKRKKRDELSLFKKGRRSKLYRYLRKNNITNISICGLAKDICVLETANDAYNLGFNVTIFENLSASINEERFNFKINKKIKLLNWTNLFNGKLKTN